MLYTQHLQHTHIQKKRSLSKKKKIVCFVCIASYTRGPEISYTDTTVTLSCAGIQNCYNDNLYLSNLLAPYPNATNINIICHGLS